MSTRTLSPKFAGPSACCCGSEITWDCESLEGTASLQGWSRLQNANTGDWNQRKFRRIQYTGPTAGEVLSNYYSALACGGTLLGPFTHQMLRQNQEPGDYDEWGTTNHVLIGIYACGTWYGTTGDSMSTAGANMLSMDVSILGWSQVTNYLTDLTESKTRSRGSSGCASTGYNFSGCGYTRSVANLNFSYTVTQELQVPDTVYAALARSTPTSGSECETVGTSIATTVARSNANISITGRAVKVIIHLPIAAAGTYTFVVDLQPKLMDGTPEAAEEEEITISVDPGDIVDGTVDYEYVVPVRTDRRVQFVAARDLVSA
jgi:hypothetical protein